MSLSFVPASVTLAGVANPHGKLKWDCQKCHTAKGWKEVDYPLKFDHSETGFALTGSHQSVNCVSCHKSLKFSRVGIACADCHKDVHQGAFGVDCQSCHAPRNWSNRKDIFEKHAQQGFPLLGVHAIADCEACHKREQVNQFKGTPLDCQGCHASDYQKTVSPKHAAARFSMDCQICHSMATGTWYGAGFVHSDIFPLRGAHKTADCRSCHTQNTFKGLSQDCVSCHRSDYQTAALPPHAAAAFPTECQLCHNETKWQGATFEHTQRSGFALQGAHARLECVSCHVNNQMTGLPRDCYGCHQQQFAAVKNPDHQAGNFSHDCMTCHTQDHWSPATFDHSQTNFPLQGAHKTLDCQKCHASGYTNIASDCYSCHRQNFEATTNPDHVSNNFSHNCMTCHSQDAWSPATFDHSKTNFPLTGAHVSLECKVCHTTSYANTPTDCYSCHKQKYLDTTDPNHQAAGFPTNCESCHNTSDWSQATWDHDGQYFPIYSGKHRGKWDTCSDCHVDAANFQVFECINCHEHNKSKMDSKHAGKSGYVYQSSACYNCHPNGRE